MKNNKTFWVTWLTVLSMAAIAFILVRLDYINYGVALFRAVPLCIVLFTGFMPNFKKAIVGTIAAIALFLLLLSLAGFEGVVCIIMAIPVVGACIFVGYLIAIIIKHFTRQKENLKLTVFPICLFIAAIGIESFWQGTTAYDEVSSSIQLAYPVSAVYDNIKHVDTVNTKQNWMHAFGLPYPRKCILTNEKVGGLRICEFDEGNIIETITCLKQNELLEMDVTEFNLPGQRWLSFKKDIYVLKGDDKSTTISRTTTYNSSLKPRMYWKWIEEITIGAEQDLVFENLKNGLAAKQ